MAQSRYERKHIYSFMHAIDDYPCVANDSVTQMNQGDVPAKQQTNVKTLWTASVICACAIQWVTSFSREGTRMGRPFCIIQDQDQERPYVVTGTMSGSTLSPGQ